MSRIYNNLKEILSEMGICMSSTEDGFSQFLTTVGNGLRGLRVERGLEIETVCRELDMSPTVLRKIEAGQYQWEVWQIAHLRDYYESVPKTNSTSAIHKTSNTTSAHEISATSIMKSKVIYTPELMEKLNQALETSREFTKEDPNKSLDQFLTELNFIGELLQKIKRQVCS